MKYVICLLGIILCCSISHGQVITTIAGTGTRGYTGDGGAATAAQIDIGADRGIVFDKKGNLYLAARCMIRKIDTAGTITTVAGTGTSGFSGDGGPATAAQFNVSAIAFDGSGNMYLCGNARIRKIDTSGIINTIAGTGTAGYSGDGGPATSANITNSYQLSFDSLGNIYFAQGGCACVRKISVSGIITTVAGNGLIGYTGDGGPATNARINVENCAFSDRTGNIYISTGGAIRKVNTSGIITTIAGTGTRGYSGDGGPATAALMQAQLNVHADACGNIYISDLSNFRIRKISTSGFITTIAGTGSSGFSGDGGPASAAQISLSGDHAFDAFGNFYFSDYYNERIRKIAHINNFPSFVVGTTPTLTVCENAATTSIDSLLRVLDTDSLQSETWSVLTAPLHGTLVASYSTTTTGSTLIPTGLTYTPAAGYSGTDTFRVRVSDCGNLADTITIYVTVVPILSAGIIAGPSTVCVSETIALSDTPAGGTWIATNGRATVSGTGVVTGVALGADTILYVVSNSCSIDTAIHGIAVVPGDCHLVVGNLQFAVGSPRVYPNPATNELTIEISGEVASYLAMPYDLTICDIVGREVLQPRMGCDIIATGAALRLDISDLPNGIYFVRIVDKITGTVSVQKLLKE